MVSKEKFIDGIIEYVDKEVLPPLPTAAQWGIGAIVVIAKGKTEDIISAIQTIPAMRALEIVDEEGRIDEHLLCSALSESARRYGNIKVSYPIVGTLSFSERDIERLEHYIGET